MARWHSIFFAVNLPLLVLTTGLSLAGMFRVATVEDESMPCVCVGGFGVFLMLIIARAEWRLHIQGQSSQQRGLGAFWLGIGLICAIIFGINVYDIIQYRGLVLRNVVPTLVTFPLGTYSALCGCLRLLTPTMPDRSRGFDVESIDADR